MPDSQKDLPLVFPGGRKSIPNSWNWHTLDNLCSGIFDCPHSTPQITTSGPLLARTQDIISGVFRPTNAARVSEITYQERVKRAKPSWGDLLYSREGTYFGIAAEVPRNMDVCLGQRMVLIRPKSSVLNHRFLRYWLNSPSMQSHIHGLRDGSVAQRLNLPSIRKLPVATPNVHEQQAIAAALGALDDKIAANERIIRTSEELCNTLHKKVHSQAEREIELGEATDLLYGKSLPKSKRVPGAIPVYGSGGQSGTHNKALVFGPGIIIGRKGTVGSVYWSEGDFFPIDTTFYASPKSPLASLEYLYFTLTGLNLASMNSDSAVPGLNRSEALSRKIRIPKPEALDWFTRQARNTFAQTYARRAESRTLTELRDTLLPQLMSGKLRVKDAEKIVEDNV
ncbi:restriction endonuclease [Glycomyces fuscus]|nr:restriction endonuclease [Glycomyces fuscus]